MRLVVYDYAKFPSLRYSSNTTTRSIIEQLFCFGLLLRSLETSFCPRFLLVHPRLVH